MSIEQITFISTSGVNRKGRWGNRPRWHPPGGDTRTTILLWLNLQRTADKRGRTGKKKVRGDKLQWGDTQMKLISDSGEQKRSSVFFTRKKYERHPQLPRRVTPTLVTPLVSSTQHNFNCGAFNPINTKTLWHYYACKWMQFGGWRSTVKWHWSLSDSSRVTLMQLAIKNNTQSCT